MAFAVTLVPDGIQVTAWNPEREANDVRVRQPTTVPELLQFWHYTLEGIDPAYTMGDLVRLLRRVKGIAALGPMLSCDIAAHLATADLPPDPKHNTPEEPLHYLEVFNTVWPYEYGTPATAYHLVRDFHGIGRMKAFPEAGIPEDIEHQRYAISATPLANLLAVPLRYTPEVLIERDRYYFGDDPTANKLFRGPVTIRFGEFVHAIWWELGYYGNPEQTAAFVDSLRQRLTDRDAEQAELTPLADVRPEFEP